MTFTPSAALAYATWYGICVHSSAQSAAGALMTPSYSWQFKTAGPQSGDTVSWTTAAQELSGPASAPSVQSVAPPQPLAAPVLTAPEDGATDLSTSPLL
jgi:hypothetical protein